MPTPENAGAILPLVARARAVSMLSGNPGAGERWLRTKQAPERALRMYAKAGVPTSGMFDSAIDQHAVISGFTESLRGPSAAARLILDGFVRRLPLGKKLLLTTTAPSAATVTEGKAAPLSRVVIDDQIIPTKKVTAIIAATREMLTATDSTLETLLNKEIALALGEALDARFFADLIAGVTPISSSGATAINALHDLRTALLQVNNIGTPRLAIVVGVSVAKMAASLGTADGAVVFADLSPTGGTALGVPVMVSSGIGAGDLFVLDGSCVGADLNSPEIIAGYAADLEMSDAPGSDATVPIGAALVSSWQNNLAALRGTLHFGTARLRANAIAQISNIAWGSGP